MPAYSEYAVAYDISDNRERYRVDKILKGWGFRVQKSVFECRLTRYQRTRLAASLDALKLETGSVRMYRVVSGGPIRIGLHLEEDLSRAVAYVF